jgi:hypothetical protein
MPPMPPMPPPIPPMPGGPPPPPIPLKSMSPRFASVCSSSSSTHLSKSTCHRTRSLGQTTGNGSYVCCSRALVASDPSRSLSASWPCWARALHQMRRISTTSMVLHQTLFLSRPFPSHRLPLFSGPFLVLGAQDEGGSPTPYRYGQGFEAAAHGLSSSVKQPCDQAPEGFHGCPWQPTRQISAVVGGCPEPFANVSRLPARRRPER